MIPFVDNFLNKLTMYKVILFGLLFLFGVSFIYAFFYIKPLELLFSFVVLLATCIGSNFFIAKFRKIPINVESAAITALILFFIMDPRADLDEIWIYILAGILAMASKYLIVKNNKHIFNPAVFSLFILGLIGLPVSFWWIGSSDAFPFVLLVGFLVLRKIRKLTMFSTYAMFVLIAISIFAFIGGRDIVSVLYSSILTSPLIFLGAFMLTEPLTTPPRKKTQLIYASIVGLLTGSQINIGPISTTPEFALIVGNLYSYFVSFRQRIELEFIEKKKLAPQIYEFIFTKAKGFSFSPGQYMEWTLPDYRPDIRGNRRFFTIASSPSEKEIKIGVRLSEKGSSFKNKLNDLKKGDKIVADNLSGDFLLPNKNKGKFVFLAGGVGVTPFRSMVKEAMDNHQKLDVVLFYSASNEQELIYKDLFDYAKTVGLRVIYVCSKPTEGWKGEKGRINIDLIKKYVRDYQERTYYISGPPKMVNSAKIGLNKNGILPNKIVTDYFSGY